MIQSINHVLFYSRKKAIIDKLNEVKLSKTNKTLRNNAAYYYSEKRACRKLKSLMIKPCVSRGDCLDIQDRSL